MKLNYLEQQVQELHEDGYSIRAIANEIGIDKTKVQRILKKLQDAIDTVDTDLDKPINLLDDTVDTDLDTTPNLPDDTGDTDDDTWSDTPFDTEERVERSLLNGKKPTVSVAKAYNLAEIKNITAQVWLFKLEFNEFVTSISSMHMGKSYVDINDYRGYHKKAQRLVLSAKFITDQLEERHTSLLVTQVLLSIQATIWKVITGKDMVGTTYNQYCLTDKVRSLQFWEDALEADFFHPVVY